MSNLLFFIHSHTRCGQKKMSQVLQVLNISEPCIFHIFKFCGLPKMTGTLRKKLTENLVNETTIEYILTLLVYYSL